MFIIFGFGRRTRRDHGPAFYNDCPNCKNRTFFHYIAIRVWFTLFFIPRIPYKSIHAYVCRVCSWGFPINGASEKAEALRRVEVTKRWAAKELTDEQYREALITASIQQPVGAPAPAAAQPPAPQQPAPPPDATSPPPPPAPPSA